MNMTDDKIRFSPMPGQVLGHVENFGGSDDHAPFGEPVEEVDRIEDANVITSKIKPNLLQFSGQHKVLVDVDMPVKVFESSTPGHFHLYIDKEMTWHDYRLLLGTLERVGIISAGYHDACVLRGYSTLRLPWVKKERRGTGEPKHYDVARVPVTTPVSIEDTGGWAHDEGIRNF